MLLGLSQQAQKMLNSVLTCHYVQGDNHVEQRTGVYFKSGFQGGQREAS